MSVDIPSDLSPQVSQLIAQGVVKNEVEAVTEGLKLLLKRESLRRDVNLALESLRRGEGHTEEEVYDDLFRELDEQIRAQGSD